MRSPPVTLALVLAAALAASGCAATRAPADDTDLRLAAASHAFGGRYEYLIIHSAGALADDLFVNLGSVGGPSQLGRDLATRLTAAENGTLRILVTGADAQKTLQVIRDAFAVHVHNRLPGLEFLFLGEPASADEVRALVERVGGRFRFAPYES